MLGPQELTSRLVASGVRREEISGCSKDEVVRLEKTLGLVFPESYRQFLLAVGHGAGDFMDDAAWDYDELFRLTDEVREDFGEFAELPDKAFVLLADGTTFVFFIADNSTDAPVYYWNEREGRIDKGNDSFWGFIEEELSKLEQSRRL